MRVVPDNEAALACYRASGFAAVSAEERRRFNEGQPVGYVWLRRVLTGGTGRRSQADREPGAPH